MRVDHLFFTHYYRHSIKIRLLGWFLLFSLAPLSLVGYFAYSTASKTLKTNVAEKMSQMAIDKLDKIDRNLFERMNDVQVWSTLEVAKMAVQVGSGVGGAWDFVNYLTQKYRVYSLLMLLDQKGTCVTVNTVDHANAPIPTEKLLLGQNFQREPWFADALHAAQQTAVVTDWQRVAILETLAAHTAQKRDSAYSMVFSAPIRDFNGTVLGVWANFINWDAIQEILAQLPTELPETAAAAMSLLVLSDHDTLMAASGLKSESARSLYGQRLATDLRQPQLVKLLAAPASMFTYSWNGQPKTIAVAREKGYQQYPGKQWRYLLISDNAAVYAQVNALRSKILLIAMLSASMILVLAYLIGTRIAAPLVLLSKTAGAIAHGDLSPRIALTIPYESIHASRNEIHLLLRSFIQMTEKLQYLIRQIQNASTRVNDSSGQISAALQQSAQISRQQSSDLLQTTAMVEQVAATSREIAKSATTVAGFAGNTEQEAQKGVNAAVGTLIRIQEIKQVNDQNMRYVSALNACSQEINKIVEVITTLADNTELIAFNAALEAAGAGEAGQRFGVVAGEMRRLANTVAASVKHIERKTAEIQQGIKTLVSSFETETQQIENGVQDMQVAAGSLETILEKIRQTTLSVVQISDATQHQQLANEQIVAALRQMSLETLQFQDIAEQTLAITMELNRLAEELLQTVNVFHVEA